MTVLPHSALPAELFGEPNRLSLVIRAAQIIVIDDMLENVTLVTRILAGHGFQSVAGITDPRQLPAQLAATPPDLVITDLHMPESSTFGVLDLLAPLVTSDRLAVLVVTGDDSSETRHEALARGARDFVNKPFDAVELTLRVRNLLESRVLFKDLRRQNQMLLSVASGSTRQLHSTRMEMLQRLAMAAECHDVDPSDHNQRVGELSARLALAVGWTRDQAELLRAAAALHDIGTVGIPDALLRKPGALSESEAQVMRTHTTIGARILGGSKARALQMAETIALSHHERWDGNGYPHRLQGSQIPWPGRVVALADAFDAITHDRPYRARRSADVALEVIRDDAGHQFDPHLVDALGRVLKPATGYVASSAAASVL